MRQLAWLQAVPEPPETAGKKPPRKQGKPDKSRMQLMQDLGQDLPIPDPGPAAYLVGYLFEAGPVEQGGKGAVPLTQKELRCLMDNIGIELQPWEVQALRRLSAEYASASHQATAHDAPPPYTSAPEPDRRTAVDKALRNVFGARATPIPRKH